ncbi:sensor histidine kinase [Kiloniella spongiae]|uniref:sensor histidine kinase n=1 Tax=Kiloniella spongiae TaxID=1489064 RepID=UPI00069A38F4|nr:ATP-binding protein [Kiloniella spongiae]
MNTLEKKITLSFGAVCCTFLAMTVFTLLQVNTVTESSRKIQNIFVPSIEANVRLTNAINTSKNGLLGWILTQDENYVRQRKAAWTTIGKMHKQLMNYAKNWPDTEQQARLESISKDLDLFRQYQDEIEGKIHTDEKIAALDLLKEKSIPLAQTLVATLRRISDPQKWQMERIFAAEEEQENILTNAALFFLSLSFLGSILLGAVLTRAVILPLNRTIKFAESITRGNYSLDRNLLIGEEKLDTALIEMTKQLSDKKQENERQQKSLRIYNKELKFLNSELKTSNNELTQFSYRTSHDLKAPLITVRGLADIICEDIKEGDYDEVERNANHISNHVKKLERLIVDILNLAKADLKVTNEEKVDFKEIIHSIEGRLKNIYIDNNVTIETELDDTKPIYASKVRITQILENLISNGIKYCNKNKPYRYVKISTEYKKNKKLCIIEDNGIGIPKEYSNRVFEMFQRFHPDISYGSGLGMYIIKKHIDKMDAKISFESSDNGTKFIIELPEGKWKEANE